MSGLRRSSNYMCYGANTPPSTKSSTSKRALVITPLAVHSLAFRPIIASPDEPITITVARVNDGTTLVIDGQLTRHLETGYRVHVRRGHHRVRMIRDPGTEFWSTVVRKMRWATGPTYRDR